MHTHQVPQDAGMSGTLREIAYALDRDGRYQLVPSLGWQPKIIANRMAWQEIADSLADSHRRVLAGQLSPLAFHMTKHQMDLALLARYARLWRWQVRRHLRPAIFRRLRPALLERYARIFDIPVAELAVIPDTLPTLPHMDCVDDGD